MQVNDGLPTPAQGLHVVEARLDTGRSVYANFFQKLLEFF
jgi:nitrate reductase assembly molybdenum cofactor insertion protein NarJ